jgi:hypothetical protein
MGPVQVPNRPFELSDTVTAQQAQIACAASAKDLGTVAGHAQKVL